MIALGVLLLIIAAFVVLGAIGWGAFLLLVQFGVIVKEAGKPVHQDNYDYSLKQGREVGREEDQR